MKKSQRLQALNELLRGETSTTAEAIADKLGVSLRTVRRDLAELREAGTPLNAEPGRGGGVRLEGDRGVTAVHLTIAEVVTLWLGARLSQAASDLPWGGAATSALNKLIGSLPKKRASDLRALCRRVVVGPPAEAEVTSAAGAAPPELLRIVEEAFAQSIGMAFHYEAQNGRSSMRRVEPHGLLVQTPVWYLLARDLDKGAHRMFRMDRVSRPRVMRSMPFAIDERVIWSHVPDEPGWEPLIGARPPVDPSTAEPVKVISRRQRSPRG